MSLETALTFLATFFEYLARLPTPPALRFFLLVAAFCPGVRLLLTDLGKYLKQVYMAKKKKMK